MIAKGFAPGTRRAKKEWCFHATTINEGTCDRHERAHGRVPAVKANERRMPASQPPQRATPRDHMKCPG